MKDKSAFPGTFQYFPTDTSYQHEDGMTLREYYAGLAMQGLLASGSAASPKMHAVFAVERDEARTQLAQMAEQNRRLKDHADKQFQRVTKAYDERDKAEAERDAMVARVTDAETHARKHEVISKAAATALDRLANERDEARAELARLKERPRLTMTLSHFRDAIQFVNADPDEDGETEFTFAYRDAGVDEDGEAFAAGLVVYYTDYPEEGCIALNGPKEADHG